MSSREEKLVVQVRNIENILSSEDRDSAEKVYLIIQQMSFLNALVNEMIDPLLEEIGRDHQMVKLAKDSYVEVLEEDRW